MIYLVVKCTKFYKVRQIYEIVNKCVWHWPHTRLRPTATLTHAPTHPHTHTHTHTHTLYYYYYYYYYYVSMEMGLGASLKQLLIFFYIQFASDYEDPNFPTIDIHVKPGRTHLTAKSMQVCKTGILMHSCTHYRFSFMYVWMHANIHTKHI